MGASGSAQNQCVDDAKAKAVDYVPGFGSCCLKNNDTVQVVMEIPVYSVDPGPYVTGLNGQVPSDATIRQLSRDASPQQKNARQASTPSQQTMSPPSQASPSMEDIAKLAGQTTYSQGLKGTAQGEAAVRAPTPDPELVNLKPLQCWCCLSALDKATEPQILQRKEWCCYSCCAGCGYTPLLDPLFAAADCCLFHGSCESAYLMDDTGVCSQLTTCCTASCVAFFPLEKQSPACIIGNERCCFYGGKRRMSQAGIPVDKVGDQQFGTVKPGSISSFHISPHEEARYVIANRHVACFCCCCGCAEAYQTRNCCGYATKCGCCRWEGRWGLPNFPGCAMLSLCGCAFAQCRCPGLLPNTPCCICLSSRCDFNGTKTCCNMCPRRCPKCCEKLKCCSLSEFWARCFNCFDLFAVAGPPVEDYSVDMSWQNPQSPEFSGVPDEPANIDPEDPRQQ